ncbi:hypothetical protein ABT034_27610 [Streptomyces sp. NPDC002773]|uniref:hypothetical protein n=1 Tax=Streptomyces sp. NPDC002773 TaxID=3154430 RepID=UPI0033261F17
MPAMIWKRSCFTSRDARRDLGRLIARIDDEFERRTLPNPGPVDAFRMGGWWWSRIREH